MCIRDRQQPVSLGSRPYLCVVVQGIAQLGEYTKSDQHGRDKRYGMFSTVNWTLMYDVENHCYANESPGTVQVFHFKPKSHPPVSYTHLLIPTAMMRREGRLPRAAT